MNYRNLAIAAAIGFGAAAAQASDWTLTLHDFDHVFTNYDTGQTIDYGIQTISADVNADDVNHDGTLDLSEVNYMIFDNGVAFSNYIDPSTGQYVHQDIFTFSYGPAGLDIYANSDHEFLQVTPAGYAIFGDSAPFSSDLYQQAAGSYVTMTAVPEPASTTLLALGLAALALRARRGKRA